MDTNCFTVSIRKELQPYINEIATKSHLAVEETVNVMLALAMEHYGFVNLVPLMLDYVFKPYADLTEMVEEEDRRIAKWKE